MAMTVALAMATAIDSATAMDTATTTATAYVKNESIKPQANPSIMTKHNTPGLVSKLVGASPAASLHSFLQGFPSGGEVKLRSFDVQGKLEIPMDVRHPP